MSDGQNESRSTFTVTVTDNPGDPSVVGAESVSADSLRKVVAHASTFRQSWLPLARTTRVESVKVQAK